MDQVDSFIYLGSIICKDDGRSEDIKRRNANAQCVFLQFKKKSREDQEEKTANQDYNIGGYGDDSGQYGCEAWALQKTEDGLLDVKSKM